MAIPATGDSAASSVGRQEFFDELATVTRERPATAYLYLMLRERGEIGVQWEQPGVDHLRVYRIDEPGGPACPHCAILDAVPVLAPVLPLDVVRTARTRPQYAAVLRTGLLPQLAFGRRAGGGRDTSWLGDCHGAPGNPHTDADCAEHRLPAPVHDLLDGVESVPPALQEVYPDGDAAGLDVARRLRVAREWRDAALAVADGLREAEATTAFLRTSVGLGVPAPAPPGTLFVLPPDGTYYDQPLADLRDGVPSRLMSLLSGGPPAYQEIVCLVPDARPTERRVPAYAGAVDIGSGRPTRTIQLPSPQRQMSARGRGVLLLFETRHAMGQRVVPAAEKSAIDWQSEAGLHVFEFGLLRGIGGEAYESAVGAYVQALRKTGDLLARPEKVLDRRRRDGLARVFGDIDDRELHLWASVAYRNAIMLMLGDLQAFAEHLRFQAGQAG